MSNLIVGCGYVGRRLAAAWTSAGEIVYATTRSETHAREFVQCGWSPVLFDVTQEATQSLPNVKNLVFAVGFDRSTAREQGHSIDDVYVSGLRRTLKAAGQFERLIYVSSTGVYGQNDGDWVDEDAECKPTRPGGKACLAAETLLRSHPAVSKRATILRLAGIYGPNRLPQAELLKNDQTLAAAPDSFLNLIHVDDVVRAIMACTHANAQGQTYCVSDGHPVPRAEFYEYLAGLLGAKRPRFEPPKAGTTRAERSRGSKRIRNDRFVRHLDFLFRYPTYKEGLAAIADHISD